VRWLCSASGGLAPLRPDHVLCNPGLASLLKAPDEMSRAEPLTPISDVPTAHEAQESRLKGAIRERTVNVVGKIQNWRVRRQ